MTRIIVPSQISIVRAGDFESGESSGVEGKTTSSSSLAN
jgi:hypothetical protein